jgi:hypothetical protein
MLVFTQLINAVGHLLPFDRKRMDAWRLANQLDALLDHAEGT